MTLRAEDDHGYVAVPSDGLEWESKKAWEWVDGDWYVATHTPGLYCLEWRAGDNGEGLS